jgi:hypothetical protein
MDRRLAKLRASISHCLLSFLPPSLFFCPPHAFDFFSSLLLFVGFLLRGMRVFYLKLDLVCLSFGYVALLY